MSKRKLPWPVQRGYPLPLGATLLGEGINFAFFSRHGDAVTLVIEPDQGDESERYEIELVPGDHRTGDIWHVLLVTSDTSFTYGYRVFGPATSRDRGLVYQPDHILIDPYCQCLRPRPWGEQSHYGTAPCCRLIDHDFDWGNDRHPKTPLAETVIYELHVRGFSKQDSSLQHGGSYRALQEKIPYFKQLGVTAIELMPVTEFDENDTVFRDPESGARLHNYWGYSPVSFFALKSGYAAEPDNHINEFKETVRQLHAAGIEVILDIVYNHTGEGGYDGTTSSFRGIDNPIYYLLDPYDRQYRNFSGCGNTLNCNHPIVRSLIRDSLRYWVTEMHVDGFRFDLASILGRDQEGNVLPNPPMIEIIAEDPVLRDTKIIAEAWDAAGLYQVGSFSSDSRWGEWNGRFRDDVRAFMADHEDTVTRLATRIAGSSDLYEASRRTPLSSINFLTSHDGFTLYDLVSYDRKHNLPNGEQNRDGENHNLSWNSGHEGSPAPPPIEKLRLRRMRSMLVVLFLSQGVPMLTAGDEFARSQRGNNNAWCQDNTTSWLDWQLLTSQQALHRFCTRLIALRRRHPVFRREEFFRATAADPAGGREEIRWQYLTPGEQNWSADCRGLGFLLYGDTGKMTRDDDFFVMLNGHRTRELSFAPPAVPWQRGPDRVWQRIIDTGAPPPADFPDTPIPHDHREQVIVAPLAAVVLQSRPRAARP